MESLPLTCSAPFEEFPAAAGIESLFPELAPSGARPVEVTVTVPERDGRRVVMHIVAAEVNAGRAFGLAFGACEGIDGFEITARRFAG
jgi:hypothetical protein